MNKTLAESLSVAFHPLLVSSYLMALLLMAVPYTYHYNMDVARFIMIFTFVFTFVLPVISLFILKQYGMITSIKVEKRKERTFPYLISSFFFFAAAYIFYGSEMVYAIFPHILVIIGLCILVVSGVNLFQKISAHAIGMSGLTAVVFRLCFMNDASVFIYVLMLSVVLTGIVAAARLSLKAHRPKEIYSGIGLGFLVAIISSFLLI